MNQIISQRKKLGQQASSNNVKCSLCNDVGMVISKTEGVYTSYKPCKCLEMDKLNAKWRNSGLSIADLDKTFSNFDAWNDEIKKLKDIATGYYLTFEKNKKSRSNSILLSGVPGCGKTHLALALCNNFLKNGKKVLYMPYTQASIELKQNVINAEEYKNTMGQYKNAEILLIDDLLKGKSTEYDKNILFELINHRYINNMPMIISTEKSVSELLEFDQAIGSRIFEMTQNYNIFIKGVHLNYRMKGFKG